MKEKYFYFTRFNVSLLRSQYILTPRKELRRQKDLENQTRFSLRMGIKEKQQETEKLMKKDDKLTLYDLK